MAVTGAMIAIAAVSAYSQQQTANANQKRQMQVQQQQDRYKARIATNNAAIAKQNQINIGLAEFNKKAQARQAAARAKGQITATAGASNLLIEGGGSVEDALSDIAAAGAANLEEIENEARANIFNAQLDEANASNSASLLLSNANNAAAMFDSPLLAGFSAAAGGAGSAAGTKQGQRFLSRNGLT